VKRSSYRWRLRMRFTMRISQTLIVAVLGVISMAPNCPTCGISAYGPNGAAVSTNGLTAQQFNGLPDSTVLERKGVRMTKAEFGARLIKGRADAEARRRAFLANDQAKFQAYRARYFSDRRARLQQQNARFQAEVAHRRQLQASQMTPQRQALYRESWDLLGRAKHSPPAEHAQLDQRAAQIMGQLRGSSPVPENVRGPMNHN
jgi:hypothetical protein